MLTLFFFNDTATTEIYTLSLHDALPIYPPETQQESVERTIEWARRCKAEFQRLMGQKRLATPRPLYGSLDGDRKSTRLNSSHTVISYAVFCLKKKKTLPAPSSLLSRFRP